MVLVRWPLESQLEHVYHDLAPIGQPASGNDSMSAFDTSRARIFVLGGQFSDHHLYTLSNNAFSAVTISGANASDVASVVRQLWLMWQR